MQAWDTRSFDGLGVTDFWIPAAARSYRVYPLVIWAAGFCLCPCPRLTKKPGWLTCHPTGMCSIYTLKVARHTMESSDIGLSGLQIDFELLAFI
jgi:hypothetical protein